MTYIYSKRPDRKHDFTINVESLTDESSLEMLIWVTELIDRNTFYGFYCIEENWEEGAASQIKMENGNVFSKHDKFSTTWQSWDGEDRQNIISSYRKLIFNEIELILLGEHDL